MDGVGNEGEEKIKNYIKHVEIAYFNANQMRKLNSYAGQYWSTIKFSVNITHINFN